MSWTRHGDGFASSMLSIGDPWFLCFTRVLSGFWVAGCCGMLQVEIRTVQKNNMNGQ